MSGPHLWVVSFFHFQRCQSLKVWKRPWPTLSQLSVEAKVRQTKHWYLCDAPDGDMKAWWIYWDLSPRVGMMSGDELGCSLYMGSPPPPVWMDATVGAMLRWVRCLSPLESSMWVMCDRRSFSISWWTLKVNSNGTNPWARLGFQAGCGGQTSENLSNLSVSIMLFCNFQSAQSDSPRPLRCYWQYQFGSIRYQAIWKAVLPHLFFFSLPRGQDSKGISWRWCRCGWFGFPFGLLVGSTTGSISMDSFQCQCGTTGEPPPDLMYWFYANGSKVIQSEVSRHGYSWMCRTTGLPYLLWTLRQYTRTATASAVSCCRTKIPFLLPSARARCRNPTSLLSRPKLSMLFIDESLILAVFFC